MSDHDDRLWYYDDEGVLNIVVTPNPPDESDDSSPSGTDVVSVISSASDIFLSSLQDVGKKFGGMSNDDLKSFRAFSYTRAGVLNIIHLGIAAAEGDSSKVAKVATSIAVGVAVSAGTGVVLAGVFPVAATAAIAATVGAVAGHFAAEWLKDERVTDWLRDNLNSINDKIDAATEWFGDQWDRVTEGVADVFERTKEAVADTWDDSVDWAQAAADAVRDMVRSAWGFWTNNFINDVRDFFNRGESHASPIILDLDGNGISTLGLEAGVQFDHNGDGFAQATGWVGPADALLAMDLTGNEEIETGSELFGNASEIEEGVTAMNGFEALAIMNR